MAASGRPRKQLTLFLVTASILPSVQALWELHALSPSLALDATEHTQGPRLEN